jgi:Rhodopirellula transposase DDE domain
MQPRDVFEKKGGRKKASSAEPELVPQLKQLVELHTAGSPVEPSRVWTSRSCESFSEELAEFGFSVSANTVDRLLRNELGLSRRKMEKSLAMGESADRDAQFQRMKQVKRYFGVRGWPVLSIDTKKKELLGRFERGGQAWTNDRLQAWDHDFPSSSWGKVIPYGVYDLAANEALVYLAQGADTGELACDAIRRWWHRLGKWRYDATSPILLLADCGGSNGYRVPLFRQQLYQLSQLLRRAFRVCHLPPYCSKYNPIDHRLFCHLSRSLQAIQLISIEAIYQALQQTTTRTGLRVVCELARKLYAKGIKADPEFLADEPTQRDKTLSAYNYKFSPN